MTMNLRFFLGALGGVLLAMAVVIAGTGLLSSASAGPFAIVSPQHRAADLNAYGSSSSTSGQILYPYPANGSGPSLGCCSSGVSQVAVQPVLTDVIVLLPIAAGLLFGVLLWNRTREKDAEQPPER